MKKISLLLILVSLFLSDSNAQVNAKFAGHVIYKFTPNEQFKKENKDKNEFEKLKDRLNKESASISFNLEFKGNKSFFYIDNVVSNDATPLGMDYARNLVGRGNFLTDLDKKTVIREVDKFGEKNLIKSKTKSLSDWKLIKESKMIGNYKCYKAITNKTYKSALGKIVTIEIIAWYAPQIPVKFGIKQYNNLPGLILELKDHKHTFYAHKISFVKESKIEIKPLKGKTITEEEYLKLVEESSGFIIPTKKGN